MTETFLQDQLGTLIYDLAEIDFNCIKSEFFQKHINENVPFTEAQIKCFKMFLECLFDHLEDLKEVE